MIHVFFTTGTPLERTHHEWPTDCVLLDCQSEGRGGVYIRVVDTALVIYYNGKEVRKINFKDIVEEAK